MHAAPTAVQVDISPKGQFDPLGKFTEHRRYNRPIAMSLQRDAETRDVGNAIANCAWRLNLDIPLVDDGLGKPLLRGAHICNRRLCPFCEWRRTRVWRARLINGLDAFSAEFPKHRGLFLTLTVRNCQMHELRQTIRDMHESLKRLSKVSIWPTQHWMRRTEITVSLSPVAEESSVQGATTESAPTLGGRRIQSVHPHMHCLLLVRPSYWSRDYVKQLEWQRQWQMAARLDYSPVVDVRAAKVRDADDPHCEGLPTSAVIEAAKYASKATDLLALGDQLPAFHHEMRGLRLYGISKQLQRYISAADVTKGDLLDASPVPPEQDAAYLSAVAQWFDDSQEYRFVT